MVSNDSDAMFSVAPIRSSRLAPILRPIQAFLSAEAAGGMVLLIAALIALAWANSPWGDSYAHFWHKALSIRIGQVGHAMSLEHWVNDGLMVIFFLLVGLEIKRELVVGELASPQRAALPVAAALGGMLVPALIYAGFNARGEGAAGWGIPMATDIAFAVGVLALVGRRLPVAVKVFLLAIAIVDDLGAVLVIALFYTSHLSMAALGLAGLFLAVLILLNLLGVHRPLPYLLIGVALWAATLASGLHATVAGVLLAFTIPATRQMEGRSYVEFVGRMLRYFEREAAGAPRQLTAEQGHAIQAIEEASEAVQTPLARVEHALLAPVNFLIVPLFALANAGVDLRGGASDALRDPVAWGVTLGLLAGKPIGVLLASWMAIRTGIAAMPAGATPRQLAGVGLLCGIGFTMSIFVANLAFPTAPEHLAAAKLGILSASLLAGILGGLLIATSMQPGSKRNCQAARQETE